MDLGNEVRNAYNILRFRKFSSISISRHVHFKSIVEAFSGMSPRGEQFHRLVALCILVETDWNISRICMLDYVSVFLVPFQYHVKDYQSMKCKPIHLHTQCFVTFSRGEDVKDCFLGWYTDCLFED